MVPKLAGVVGQVDVLPGPACRVLVACAYHVPPGGPEITMFAGVLARLERGDGYVVSGEVSDGIASRLVQEYDVLAVGDPLSTESHAHAATQRLGEQQWLG
jgi:hypothetical protein